MKEPGSTGRRRTACSHAVAGGRPNASREARESGARARDRSPGGAPPCSRWRPERRPNEPRMAAHSAAPRARAWIGGRRVLRMGRVPATARGGAFEAPRTASPATLPHAAPPTRRATPTLARGLVRAPVSARSPPRGSGRGTSRPTHDVRLPHDRFDGGCGPNANRDKSTLITGHLPPGDDRSASLPTFLRTFPAANHTASIRSETFKDI